MKRTIFLSIALLLFAHHSYAYICSGVTYNNDTATAVLCAEDYNPYSVGGDPTSFNVVLPANKYYQIYGHIEMEQVAYSDGVVIREIDENNNTLNVLRSYSGVIEDISVISQYKTGKIVIDIHCFYGAVCETSGFSLTIQPVEIDTMNIGVVTNMLGIGTTSPEEALDVVGNLRVRKSTSAVTIEPAGAHIRFKTNNTDFYFNKPVRSNGTFGTAIGANLTLQTHDTARVTVLNSNGYVGIGTTEPQAMLHVNGSVRGNGENGTLTIQTNSGKTTIGAMNWAYSHFWTNLPRFHFNKGITVSNGAISSGSGNDLFLQTCDIVNGAPAFTSRLSIQGETGNVGIGTTTPLAKLHVNGNMYIAADSTANGWGYSRLFWGQHSLQMGTLPGTYAHIALDLVPGGVNTVQDTLYSKLRMYSAANTTTKLQRIELNTEANSWINTRGNFGIGTSSPQYKLDVHGTIRANEILVNTNGADYVFDENYQLRSLQDVQAYIQENKHLPDVQSAEQMQQEGVSVSDLQTTLLRKIEELTLYIIEQGQKIQDLQQQLNDLKQ